MIFASYECAENRPLLQTSLLLTRLTDMHAAQANEQLKSPSAAQKELVAELDVNGNRLASYQALTAVGQLPLKPSFCVAIIKWSCPSMTLSLFTPSSIALGGFHGILHEPFQQQT